MKKRQVVENFIREIIDKITEKVEFGEFGNDFLAWRAANLIHDGARAGIQLGRLFGYLKDENSGKLTDRLFAQVLRKLKDTGDYVIVPNPSDKWRGKIYYKAFKPS